MKDANDVGTKRDYRGDRLLPIPLTMSAHPSNNCDSLFSGGMHDTFPSSRNERRDPRRYDLTGSYINWNILCFNRDSVLPFLKVVMHSCLQ